MVKKRVLNSPFLPVLITVGYFLLVGCTTTLSVRTDPTGATASLERVGQTVKTDQEIQIPETYFGKSSSIQDKLALSKDGYRTEKIGVTIRKNAANNTQPTVVRLAPLDTVLRIESEPKDGVRGQLSIPSGTPRPLDMPTRFRTPFEYRMTSSEAKKIAKTLFLEDIQLDGYAMIDGTRKPREIYLQPGEFNSFTLNLEPIVTTLTVQTNPDGASIEDIAESGFQYLGSTPITRNFDYEEIVRWAENKNIPREGGPGFRAVNLTLRATLAGHRTEYKKISVPVGQSRTIQIELNPLAEKISFSSDPEGAHVYLVRKEEIELFNVEADEYVTDLVEYEEHLTTTPSPYHYSEGSVQLRHGDRIVFRKSGYQDVERKYVDGKNSYHVVMDPKVIKAR